MAVTALAVALSLAACSGGDGDSESGSQSTLTPATATTQPQSSNAGNEQFCARARLTDEQVRQAQVSGTAQAVETRYNAAAEAMRGMVDVTPGELKEDAETLARAYGAFVEEMRKVGWSGSRLPAGAREMLGAPDVRAAGERIEAYQRRVCGTAP